MATTKWDSHSRRGEVGMTRARPVVVVAACVALTLATAIGSIVFGPPIALLLHGLWLVFVFWSVATLLREPTEDLSGWRRAVVWGGGALTLTSAYVFIYLMILVEVGTRVLGWRP
jgi:hypothetical protein